MRRQALTLISLLFLANLFPAMAQQSWFSEALVQRRETQQAFLYIDQNQNKQVEEWIKITEIPAPSGHELQRALYIESEMKKARPG